MRWWFTWVVASGVLALPACGPGLFAHGASDTGDTSTGEGDGGGDTTGSSDSGDGETCPPGTLDCPCYPNENCEPDLECEDGTCVEPLCGNGELDPGEECDDGNHDATDDCDMECRVSGKQEWMVVIDGAASRNDEAEGVVIDSNGDIVVAGYVGSDPESNAHDFWMGKLSPDGEILWTSQQAGSELDDRIYAIAALEDGEFVVAGMTASVDTVCDVWLSRRNPDSTPVWTRTYDGADSECDAAFGVAASPSGDIVVAGHENALDGTSHAWIRGYSGVGDPTWTTTWGEEVGQVVIVHAVAYLPGGDFVIAGLIEGMQATDPDEETERNRLLQRRTATGALEWSLADPLVDSAVLYGVAPALGGGVVTAGSVNSTAWAWRWEDGPLESWGAEHIEPETHFDRGARVGEAVAVDSAGNVVLVGRVSDGDNLGSGQDILIAKHTPDGDRLWVKHYDGPASANDRAHAVAIDAEDHIVVAGMTTEDDADGDIWVAKYGP